MLTLIAIGFCVVVILIIVICIAVKKQLRISNYGQNVIGIVLTCINIFTSRTIQENTRLFVFIHALGFIMVPLWLVSQAFEVWYPLKWVAIRKTNKWQKQRLNEMTTSSHASFWFQVFRQNSRDDLQKYSPQHLHSCWLPRAILLLFPWLCVSRHDR